MTIRNSLAEKSRLKGALSNPSTAVVGTVLLTNFVRIFSSIILTRLLTSSDYGVVGIITSLTYIIVMITDFGFFSFVVRHDEAQNPKFLDEVWTIRLIRSAALTVLLILLAYPYASFTGKSAIAPAIAVWAFNQLLEGCSSMAFAQSVRQGLVARLSWMEFSIGLFQTIATILLALWLRSYWSIVFAGLLGGVVKLFLSYLIFPQSKRKWRFSRERQRELWVFSRFIAGSSFLTLLIGQTDKVVLSRILSLETFGLYSIATLLALAPRAVVYPFCNRVLYPAYSKCFREQGLSGLSAIYYSQKRPISSVYMLAMGGLIGLAPLVVGLLYDDRYAGVAPLMQIIAISALLLLNNTAAEQAMIAAGQPKAPFFINSVRFSWMALAGLLGYLAFGPIGVVWATGTIEVAAMLAAWYKLRQFGFFSMRQEMLSLIMALIGLGLGIALLTVAEAYSLV